MTIVMFLFYYTRDTHDTLPTIWRSCGQEATIIASSFQHKHPMLTYPCMLIHMIVHNNSDTAYPEENELGKHIHTWDTADPTNYLCWSLRAANWSGELMGNAITSEQMHILLQGNCRQAVVVSCALLKTRIPMPKNRLMQLKTALNRSTSCGQKTITVSPAGTHCRGGMILLAQPWLLEEDTPQLLVLLLSEKKIL